MQIIVVGLETDQLRGHIVNELDRLRKLDIVRLVDILVVAKHHDGEMVAIKSTDLTQEEAANLGAIAGALVGAGYADEEGLETGAAVGAAVGAGGGLVGEDTLWAVADVVPPGTTAAVAILEHRWAIPLRDAVRGAGGITLADAWIHPQDLVAYGITARLAGD